MRRIYFIYIILFIASLTLIISSCGDNNAKGSPAKGGAPGAGKKPPPPKVDAFVVQTQVINESLVVPGTLVAEDATEIHPEVSGRIISLNIREGAMVGKGTVLAKLYDADLQAQRKKLEIQLQIARQTEERHEQLLKIGGISKEDFNTSTLQVSNTRADLDIIKTEIDKTVIRAPFSGKLGLKQISPGAYVTPQTVLTTLQKTDALRIDFHLPEKYISQVKQGQTVKFTVDGSNRTYTGAVMATESGIEQTTRSLTIRARVKGDQTGLTPGGFAKVKLDFAPDPNALMVPSQAIIPQARGKKVALLKDSVARFVDVTTGVRDSSMVQIISGISKGDTVITTGLLSLKPDAKVTVNKITNK